MRLGSRQAIGILLTSIFLSSCTDAPTTPRVGTIPDAPSAVNAAEVIEFVDDQGRLNRIERVQVSGDMTRAVWTIDGQVAGDLLAHRGTDGSVERITGDIAIDGHVQRLDQPYHNGAPIGISGYIQDAPPGDSGGASGGGIDWNLQCIYATAAVAAAAAILAIALVSGNLIAVLSATLAYFGALAVQADYCSRAQN